MSPLVITLIILLVVFVALLSGKFANGVVGGTVIVALMVFGILTPAEALSGFSNTNVVIMFCMMVLSAGLMKTNIIHNIVKLVNKVGRSETALVAGFGLIAAIMAQFMNAFVAVGCLLPFIVGMCRELKIPRSKVVFPVMIIALTFIFWLPIGQGVSYNVAQPNGYLESFGSEIRFGMFDMTLARLAGCIVQPLFCIFVLPKLCPDKGDEALKEGLTREISVSTLSKARETLAYVISAGTVILMILAGTLKLNICMIACAGALLMVLCGVMDNKEAIGAVNWGMIFLFAGILPLSTALTKTGASDVIADFIIKLIGGSTNPWIISIVFVAIAFVSTQFLSNTACVQVFMPLVLMVSMKLGMNPIGIMGLVNIGCTASYLTPMANPGIPLCMAAGGYDLKDCIRIGLLPGLLICAVGVVWCSLFFPAF